MTARNTQSSMVSTHNREARYRINLETFNAFVRKSFKRSINPRDLRACEDLIGQQRLWFPKIKEELEANNGKKVGHWAWWVWPTEKAGQSEFPTETYVVKMTVNHLLENTDHRLWAEILQTTADSLKSGKIPAIDLGRIGHFVRFWVDKSRTTTEKYPHFYLACLATKEALKSTRI